MPQTEESFLPLSYNLNESLIEYEPRQTTLLEQDFTI